MIMDSIKNNAYTLTCCCARCQAVLSRGYYAERMYCRKCGQELNIPAFSNEEIEKSRFEREFDEIEDL